MYFKALVHDRKGDSYKRRIHNLTSAYKKCNDIEWKSTEAVPRKKLSCFQQIYMVWKIKLQQCRHMLNWEMVTTAVLIMQKVRVTEMALLMTISLMNMIWYDMIWYDITDYQYWGYQYWLYYWWIQDQSQYEVIGRAVVARMWMFLTYGGSEWSW